MGDQLRLRHAPEPIPRVRRREEAPVVGRRLLLALLLLWLPGTESPAAHPELLAALLGTVQRYAALPPPSLDPDELLALAQGAVVRRRDPPAANDRGHRATGMLVVPAGRDATWLATQDPHGVEESDGLLELSLTASARGRSRWYGLLNLPWPLNDRCWVVEVWDNEALGRATGGRAWEHLWQLDESGLPLALERIEAGDLPELSLQRAQRAIFTPANRGSWTVLALADRESLVIFQTETAIGGAIPDRLVARFALSRLEELLRRVEAMALRMHEHYRAGHPPLLGGDGRPIPLFGGGEPIAAP